MHETERCRKTYRPPSPLPIHDELLFEVCDDKIEEIVRPLGAVMEKAHPSRTRGI